MGTRGLDADLEGMGVHERGGDLPDESSGTRRWVDAPSSTPRAGLEPVVPPAPRGLGDEPVEPVSAEYRAVRYPPHLVGFSTVPPTLQALRWDQPRGQRLRSSQVTFGPLGRSVMTALILLFVAWIGYTNVFLLILALPAVVWMFKDTWRKAPERRAPLPTVVAEAPRGAARDPFAPLESDAVLELLVRPEPDATAEA